MRPRLPVPVLLGLGTVERALPGGLRFGRQTLRVLRVAGEVLPRLGVEDHDLGRVEPEVDCVTLLDIRRRIEDGDDLSARAFAVEVPVELFEGLAHGGRRFEGQVGVDLVAQPFGDVDLGAEQGAASAALLVDRRRIVEVLGSDAGDEVLGCVARLLPLALGQGEDAEGRARSPSTFSTGRKFIGGEPMKPATKRLTGSS